MLQCQNTTQYIGCLHRRTGLEILGGGHEFAGGSGGMLPSGGSPEPPGGSGGMLPRKILKYSRRRENL